MKKFAMGLIVFAVLSFAFQFSLSAQTTTTPEQPLLPQTEEEASQKDASQNIESPTFYSETNRDSFIKGVAVGAAVGIIVGGIMVWFFRKSKKNSNSYESEHIES